MKLDELSTITGATIRQIRFLISEGFVPSPDGGRTYATYGDAHVQAIRRFQRLKGLGFPNAAIRLLLDAREGVPVPVMDGLTLVIAPDLIGKTVNVDQIAIQTEAKLREALAGDVPKARKRAAG
jgi:MerR family copper efflux transcriptional regulator